MSEVEIFQDSMQLLQEVHKQAKNKIMFGDNTKARI